MLVFRVVFCSVLLLFCCFNFSRAQSGINDLKRELSSTNNQQQQIDLLNELAWEYAFLDTDSAAVFARKALFKNNNVKDQELHLKNKAYTTGVLGIIYDIKGQRDEALNYYQESLEFKKMIQDSLGIASSFTNIGALFFSQSAYEKALNYFKDAATIELSINDNEGLEGSWINIAMSYKNLNYLDSTKHYLLKADSLNNLSQNQSNKATISANLGAILFYAQDHINARKLLNKSVLINREIGNSRNLAIALDNLAKLNIKEGKFEAAREVLEEAYQLSTKGHFINNQKNIYETLFELNLILGNIEVAYRFQDTLKIYQDSLTNSDFNTIIQKIEAQYQLEKRKIQIAERDQAILKEQFKNRQLYVTVLFLISAALGLLIIAFLIRRSRTLVVRKNEIINEALKEREVLIKEIHHRVKNNIQSIKSLIQVEKRRSENEQTTEVLNKLLLRIQAMTFIHNHVYNQEELQRPDLKDYLEKLINSILATFGYNKPPHQLAMTTSSATMEINNLITLGIVVNEIITNACKYGLNENKLSLTITGGLDEKTQNYCLTINDKGKGINPDNKKGFGSDLIEVMIKKLKGDLHVENLTSGGASFTFYFPVS